MNRFSARAGIVALALLTVVTASVAVVIAVDSGGGPAQATSSASGRTISVTGDGTVQGVPDTLVANLSVHSHEASVQAALSNVVSSMRRVMSTLRGKGVAKGDLQTTDLQLNPSYDNHGGINGYDASESLSVRIHPFARVGSVLAAAATASGNSVNVDGMTLDISNPSQYLDGARQAAFNQARAAAQRDAALAGEHLGQVVSVKELDTSSTPPPQPYGFADSLAAGPARKAVPISAGKEPVSVTLAVVWELQ
jgi:uncharacterized protein YggE